MNIWLDLEIKGDIDDAVTLLYALETNSNIKAISLLNPEKEEISFVKYWINFFKKDIPLFIHYDNKIKNNNKIHPLIKEYHFEDQKVYSLNEITEKDNYIVFGGGSYTIPNLLRKKGFSHFVLQGGFAGTNVIKNPLAKFINKEKNRSWNPNLDLNATKELLANSIKITFISKDICHDSDIDIEDVRKMKNKITKNFLLKYFNNNKKRKYMHDLLAFCYIKDNSFVETLNINMKEDKGFFSCTSQEFSKKKISISWNKNKFLNML